MKNFQKFELQNTDFIYGGDLRPTGLGGADLYDTETGRWIYLCQD